MTPNPLHNVPDERLLAELIDRHEAIGTLHMLARYGQLGVNYIDRKVLENRTRDFTDEEWSWIVPHLADYDEMVDEIGEVTGLVMDDLVRRAGIDLQEA